MNKGQEKESAVLNHFVAEDNNYSNFFFFLIEVTHSAATKVEQDQKG